MALRSLEATPGRTASRRLCALPRTLFIFQDIPWVQLNGKASGMGLGALQGPFLGAFVGERLQSPPQDPHSVLPILDASLRTRGGAQVGAQRVLSKAHKAAPLPGSSRERGKAETVLRSCCVFLRLSSAPLPASVSPITSSSGPVSWPLISTSGCVLLGPLWWC